MRVIDRTKGLGAELRKIHDDQEIADRRHKQEIFEAEQSRDYESFIDRAKQYVRGNGTRAERVQKISAELASGSAGHADPVLVRIDIDIP